MDIEKLKQFKYYLNTIGKEFKSVIEGGTKDLMEANEFAEKHIKDTFEKQAKNISKDEIKKNIRQHRKKILKGGQKLLIEDKLIYIAEKLDEIESILDNSKKNSKKNINNKLEQIEILIKTHNIEIDKDIKNRINKLKKYIEDNTTQKYNIYILIFILLCNITLLIYYFNPELFFTILRDWFHIKI